MQTANDRPTQVNASGEVTRNDKTGAEIAPRLSATEVIRLPRLFSRSECEEIIALSAGLPAQGDRFRNYGEVRGASLVSWTGMDHLPGWLSRRIAEAMHPAATAYDFDVSRELEGLKLIRYRRGNRVPWHADCGGGLTATRKLTMTALLTAPTEFDGGVLTVAGYTRDTHKNLGDVVIFPSYMAHKVTTVTRGSRNSMVVWAHGTPFR